MNTPSESPDHNPTQGSRSTIRRIPVNELLAGAEQVILLHDGQEYCLRLTRANKLILTK